MAMLAEPRKKQKWCLNPRGNLWSQDESKLGQRLLEKMGWSKGKGLGKKEDGNPDHVKVSYKNDSRGMGFKGYDDTWVSHQDDFNALLTSLRTTSADMIPADDKSKSVELKSLEDKSLKSRKRVHYHKFIRGKDLSKRSAKDLQCIFGKRDISGQSTPLEDSVAHENGEDKPLASSTCTIDSGSMQLYFAQKLAKLKKESKLDTETEITVQDCNSLPVEKTVVKNEFHFNYEEPPVPNCTNSTDIGSYENGSISPVNDMRKKKKRKEGQVLLNKCNSKEKILDGALTNGESLAMLNKKRKKPKAKHERQNNNVDRISKLEEAGIIDTPSKKKRKHEGDWEILNGKDRILIGSQRNRSVFISNEIPTEVSVKESSKKNKRHKTEDRIAFEDNPKKHKISKKSKKSKAESRLHALDANSVSVSENSTDVMLGKNERTSVCQVRAVCNVGDFETGQSKTLSQDEVANMRNATLKVLRSKKRHSNAKCVSSDDNYAVKAMTSDHKACKQKNNASQMKLKADNLAKDTDILANCTVDNSEKLEVSEIEQLCPCRSGFGAYDRIPPEVNYSLGYFRKMSDPTNMWNVQNMRESGAFRNSNIFKIKGYEVLPSFECCCSGVW